MVLIAFAAFMNKSMAGSCMRVVMVTAGLANVGDGKRHGKTWICDYMQLLMADWLKKLRCF